MRPSINGQEVASASVKEVWLKRLVEGDGQGTGGIKIHEERPRQQVDLPLPVLVAKQARLPSGRVVSVESNRP